MPVAKIDPLKVQAYLNTLLTQRSMAEMFGVAQMTIRYWRTHLGLPAIVIASDERPTVRYDPVTVTKWAKEHGKRVVVR